MRANVLLLSFLTAFAVTCINALVPADWQVRVDSLNAFYGESDEGELVMDGYPMGVYLPLLGNGYFSNNKGVRSPTNFLSGIYNGETTSPSHRAEIPATLDATVTNSAPLGVLMDVEYATYFRRGLVLTNSSSTDTSSLSSSSSYELRWFAHRTKKNLYVMELKVDVMEGCESVTLELSSNKDFTSSDFDFETVKHISTTDSRGYDSPTVTFCGDTTEAETPDGDTHHVCVVSSVVPDSLTVKKSESGKVFTFITAAVSSLEFGLLSKTSSVGSAAVERKALAAHREGVISALAGTLSTSHRIAWQSLWSTGIELDGRNDAAIAANASLYAILSSVRADWPQGLAPGGLTNYYNGHSFWDTETWMYPPVLMLHNDIARSLVDYRFNRLDGARQKAASYDPPWSGTMFPWESAFSGVETCPLFAATGLREDHISGDISFAVWSYYLQTGDSEWLRTVGFPILEGVADFWVSRSVYKEDHSAHIMDVIPPDEYVDHVDDSVYTNFVAAQALRYTVSAANVLSLPPGEKHGCEACAVYAELANDLVVLFDEESGIHPEYSGYSGDMVKQADVVLLHFPLGLEMDIAVQRADLEFYSANTDTSGPAMTWGMHSIGYLDLLDFNNANKYFNMSFQDNLQDPLKVWTETVRSLYLKRSF